MQQLSGSARFADKIAIELHLDQQGEPHIVSGQAVPQEQWDLTFAGVGDEDFIAEADAWTPDANFDQRVALTLERRDLFHRSLSSVSTQPSLIRSGRPESAPPHRLGG